MTNATAQERKDQRGAAPAARPAPAAPVQHVAPPAPHIAAPVAAAPHVAAPPPAARIAAPVQQQHIAAPVQHVQQQQQQHIAAPAHVSTPHIAAQQISRPDAARPNMARGNGAHQNTATSITRQNSAVRQQAQGSGASTGRHDLTRRGGSAISKVATPNQPNVATPTTSGRNKTLPSTAASKLANPSKAISNTPTPNAATPNTPTPNVVGQGRGNRGRDAATPQAQVKAQQQAQVQQQAQARAQIYAGRSKPILHNQIFASASTRDPAARALARATFQGGFSQFRSHDRFADRRGFRGIVIGWGGPVFWPYAYADLVDYTFWPYGNDTFWPYAYDDVYDGIFGAYAPDYSTAYASVPRSGHRQVTRSPVAAGLPAAGSAQICSGQASGLTDWPIERIAQQVGPNDAQRTLLDQLKDATAKAVNLLQSACPTDLPSTPTGRLTEMRQRIASMLQAVQLVRPALDKFYQSLTDEQKERFIALESEGTPKATRTAKQPNLAQACGGSAKQITGLPINQIQQLLHPNDAQRAALDELNAATAQAATVLNENCSPDQALTPPGRVAAMETRLSGMLKALDTVQPAMAKFYNSLNDEQKARFDRLGPRQG
jgi:hypothetical protein